MHEYFSYGDTIIYIYSTFTVHTLEAHAYYVSTVAVVMPSSSPRVDAQCSEESAIGWLGGIIIGAVLATVTLFILWATVWMIRRRQQSQYKLR